MIFHWLFMIFIQPIKLFQNSLFANQIFLSFLFSRSDLIHHNLPTNQIFFNILLTNRVCFIILFPPIIFFRCFLSTSCISFFTFNVRIRFFVVFLPLIRFLYSFLISQSDSFAIFSAPIRLFKENDERNTIDWAQIRKLNLIAWKKIVKKPDWLREKNEKVIK